MALYSSTPSNASDDAITREAMCQSSKQRGQKAVNEKKAEWRVHYQNLAPFVREPELNRPIASD